MEYLMSLAGAFVQGMGLFTIEEKVISARGEVLTRGPGNYKIPGFRDIPVQFNITLLRNSPNPRAIHSSKAMGEPPLNLASSVLFAIRDAIAAARTERGFSSMFRLDSPATVERIALLCAGADSAVSQQLHALTLLTGSYRSCIPRQRGR